MPPPLADSGSAKISFSRIMNDDIADFVSMLIVQIYSKNSNVSQPVEELATCVRKNGKPLLAMCLDEGVASYLKIKKLLRNKSRQLKKNMISVKGLATKQSHERRTAAAKYQNGTDKRLHTAYHVARNYESIAKQLLRDGLRSAKNQSMAPNTYYAMRNCIHKTGYHEIMRKKIAKALKFKPCARNETQARSSAAPPGSFC